MTELTQYVNAVAMRKSVLREGSTTRVNVAILMELEQNDIGRLLEIIRIQDEALSMIAESASSEDGSAFVGCAQLAKTKVEELASLGSKARWGDVDGN